MESIKAALNALKIGINRAKNKDVDAAIDKLPEVLDILKMDICTNSLRQTFSELVRHAVQPLYKHELALALNFSSAVLVGLYYAKVIVSEDATEQKAWETVQCAVLSGLLDHLEGNRTAKTKGQIAQAFYSPLCRLYFSTQVNERMRANSGLLTTVYILLSEIVSGLPVNATLFRKQLVGGRRLGYTIYNIKDFLPLEAILELVANLLLTFRGTSRERDKFTEEIFNPQVYSKSSEFLEILSKVATSRIWARTAFNVIKLIASLDLSFPQPFTISNFVLKGLESKNMETIFIQSAAFLSSVPVGGGVVDTLVIPFSVIAEMSLSSSDQQVSVTLKLRSPPTIGYNPVNCGQKDITVEWKVEKEDLGRFLGSLKTRKLAFGTTNLEYNRKLSIAQAGIVLDSTTSAALPPNATQDKAIAIAKLWDGPKYARGGVGHNPTSPLLHSIFPPNSEDASTNPVSPEEPGQTVFIDGEGNLTDKPTQPKQAPPNIQTENDGAVKPKAPLHGDILLNKAINVLMSAKRSTQGERDVSQPKPPPRQKRNAMLSEQSDLTDQDDIPSPTPVRKRGLRRGPSRQKGTTERQEVLNLKQNLKNKKASVPSAPPKNGEWVEPQAQGGSLSTEVKELKEETKLVFTAPAEPPTAKKRPALEAAPGNSPGPPTKKSRSSPGLAKHRPTTRYRNKGRNSSPSLINIDLDDDEPPKGLKCSMRKETKRKKEVMKDKTGKAKSVPLANRKAAANTNKQKTSAIEVKVVKANVESTMIFKAEPAAQREKLQAIAPAIPKPVKMEVATPHVPKAVEPKATVIKSSNKPQEAIWQRDSFMESVQKGLTPAQGAAPQEEPEPDSAEWEVAPEGAFQFESFHEPLEVIVLSDESTNGSKTFVTEQPIAEYWSPTKGSVESLDEEGIIVKEEDVIMIDLSLSPNTLDPMPPLHRKKEAEVVVPLREAKQKADTIKEEVRKPEKAAVNHLQKKQQGTQPVPETTSKKSVETPKYRIPRLKVRPWPKSEQKRFQYAANFDSRTFPDIRKGGDKHRAAPKGEPMESLPEIVQTILEVVIDKVHGRFDNAGKGMSLAQLAILRGAADNLKPMYDEAAEHFNALVDLEEEYASRRRKVMAAMDTLRESAHQAANSIKQVSQNHGRYGLSKKFPLRLFSKPIPAPQFKF